MNYIHLGYHHNVGAITDKFISNQEPFLVHHFYIIKFRRRLVNPMLINHHESGCLRILNPSKAARSLRLINMPRVINPLKLRSFGGSHSDGHSMTVARYLSYIPYPQFKETSKAKSNQSRFLEIVPRPLFNYSHSLWWNYFYSQEHKALIRPKPPHRETRE